MERKSKCTKYSGLIFVVLMLAVSGNLWGEPAETAFGPPPEMIDRIIHDKGNIVTTVDNWGFIGGYGYPYDLPSGEWPKNSGHDYIGNLQYWMGAVTPAGDTIVANSDEDFRPLPSLISEEETYNIRLSTDTTRYDYDPTDTVGLGLGSPAYGWRIYDVDSGIWTYNSIYSAQESTFVPGGPTGLQQSFYRFEDGNAPTSLGLELSHTICQWNYCYNEDILFVILEITNVSGVDYTDFAFAVYCDFDVGGPDGTGENGRLGDLVDFDQVENLAWTYDEDGYDPGWGPLVRTGIMGTKYLESPGGIGMTAFRTGRWEDIPDLDGGKFELIDSEQFDTSLPPTDQYYLQCTRGISLMADSTVRVVYAVIAGRDLAEFYENAATAQTLYDNYFVGPQPPATPILQARIGNKKVYLRWGDTSEVDLDPLTGIRDFKGYKLYRSSNQGYTWGIEDENAGGSCLAVDYIPVAAFQIENIGDPIQHTFIDSNLINGMEYWYCLVAYDEGDTSVPIDALQNGFGHPDGDPHVVRVISRSDPAGFYDALSTVEHYTLSGGELSDGNVYPIIFDESQPLDDEYSVIFTEDDLQTYWHLIRVDETADDTAYVLQDQTIVEGDPNMYEVAEGIRAVVRNDGDRVPRSMAQTGFAVEGDTTLHEGIFYGPLAAVFGTPLGSDKHFRSTYEIRFTDNGSIGYRLFSGVGPQGLVLDLTTPMDLPFEVWNTTLGYQVHAEIYSTDFDTFWEPEDRDYITIVDFPYDGGPHPEVFPFNHAWFFRFDTLDVNYATGDLYTIEGAPVNGADDVFTFKIDGVSASAAKAELENIRVVPDPYIARAMWENHKHYHKIQFTNLPEVCTVRVYTLGGDLVKTLEHNTGDGTVEWNMRSEDGLSIASGVYLYHVESRYGNQVGRFAVIM